MIFWNLIGYVLSVKSLAGSCRPQGGYNAPNWSGEVSINSSEVFGNSVLRFNGVSFSNNGLLWWIKTWKKHSRSHSFLVCWSCSASTGHKLVVATNVPVLSLCTSFRWTAGLLAPAASHIDAFRSSRLAPLDRRSRLFFPSRLRHLGTEVIYTTEFSFKFQRRRMRWHPFAS